MSENPDFTTVRVEWDSIADAVYVYLTPKDEWPEMRYTDDVHGDGSLMLDYAYCDDRWVLGIEMLASPVGKDNTLLSAHGWVVATQAWDRTHLASMSYPPNSHINLNGWFLMPTAEPFYAV